MDAGSGRCSCGREWDFEECTQDREAEGECIEKEGQANGQDTGGLVVCESVDILYPMYPVMFGQLID